MPGHIALFLPELRAGGAQRVILTLAKAFLERKINVDIVVARKEGAFLVDVPPGANLIDLHARFMGAGRLGLALSVLPGLIRYLKASRPDTLLSTLTGANLVAVLARWAAHVPVRLVLREASTLKNLRNPFYIFLMRKLYKRADAVISLTPYMRTELLKVLGAPDSSVVHIPNPVDIPLILDRAAEPCPHDWLEPGMPAVFITVGRLAEPKDLATLIHAFAILSQHSEVRLVILGDGPQREQLEQLIIALQLQNRVLMPGYDANPYRWMARSRGFVLSSRWEGQPNALMEAMCLRIPVVVTDYNPSIHELVEAAGEIVPVGDCQAMAEAMLRTIEKPVSEGRSGSAHRQSSVEQYEALLFHRGEQPSE
jgi:glycosyltransferase involved in cell wall biosynthesis